MVLFVIFTLIGLWGFQSVIIGFTHTPLEQALGNKELALFVSKLLATAVSTIWNYLTYSKIVFKKH
jgi:putative flippase GtrA